MSNLPILIFFGAVVLWAAILFLKDREFVKSLTPTTETRIRIVEWSELALGPMRRATIQTQALVRGAYAASPLSEAFSLLQLVIVTIVALIAVVANLAEFNMSAYSLASYLNENPDSYLAIGNFPLSAVLSLTFLLAVACAGLIYFDGLGSKTEEEPEINRKRIFNNRIRTVAFNGLLLLAVVQAWNGFSRSEEFMATADYQTQILGNEHIAESAINGTAMRIINLILGFAIPWVSAFCVGYLITFLTWIAASLAAGMLFIFLWLPTWALNGTVARLQQQFGLPPNVAAANRETEPEDPPPPTTGETQQDDPFQERAQEERDELFQRREAEARERRRVNFNPFGN
jgi:hypothetical protein